MVQYPSKLGGRRQTGRASIQSESNFANRGMSFEKMLNETNSYYLVLEELRAEGFEFQMACVFCFQHQGKNWNEANQEVLARFKRLDYVAAAYESYENVREKQCNQFLLLNSDDRCVLRDF